MVSLHKPKKGGNLRRQPFAGTPRRAGTQARVERIYPLSQLVYHSPGVISQMFAHAASVTQHLGEQWLQGLGVALIELGQQRRAFLRKAH